MLNFPRPRVRIRNNVILFAKNLMARGFPAFPVGTLPVTANTCVGARLLPYYDRFVIEILYEVQVRPILVSKKPSRTLGIDLGISNLVATSDGVLVKGGVVKTINQWYNKRLAHYRSLAATCNSSVITPRILRLHRKRMNKLYDFFHQTSRRLISHCMAQNIDTLVIGYIPRWKQHCNLGKQTNQAFVQLPFAKLIQMLEYKAKLVGITVICVNESYTSQKCNKCGHTEKNNRVSRGVFICQKCGVHLNADINAACNICARSQILSQVVPMDSNRAVPTILSDSGCVTHPFQNSF